MKQKDVKVEAVVYVPNHIQEFTITLKRPDNMDDEAWNEFLESVQDVVEEMNKEEMNENVAFS